MVIALLTWLACWGVMLTFSIPLLLLLPWIEGLYADYQDYVAFKIEETTNG